MTCEHLEDAAVVPLLADHILFEEFERMELAHAGDDFHGLAKRF